MEQEIIENTVEALESATPEKNYDGSAQQRFEFEIVDGGQKFDTAHVFKPVTDERWIEFLREQKVRGNGEVIESSETEAIERLWNDLIVEVENVLVEDGGDFRDLIDYAEKRDAIQHYVSVASLDPEVENGDVRRLGSVRRLGVQKRRVVITEAFQGNAVVRQLHNLRGKTLEDIKRYESLLRRRFKQEQTRGLRRTAKIEFVPQDEKFGKLYDDMILSTTGFVGKVPLRFKVAVIHHLFASELDEKKS